MTFPEIQISVYPWKYIRYCLLRLHALLAAQLVAGEGEEAFASLLHQLAVFLVGW